MQREPVVPFRTAGSRRAARPEIRQAPRPPTSPYFPPGGTYFASQANTSWCQYSLLAGFSTQWPSSGKLIIFDGTPRRCRVVNSCMPFADRHAEVEVVVDDEHRRLEILGVAVRRELLVGLAVLPQGGPPCSHSSNQSSSVVAYMLSKF